MLRVCEFDGGLEDDVGYAPPTTFVDAFRLGRQLEPPAIRNFIEANYGEHVLARASGNLLKAMEAGSVFSRIVANMENAHRRHFRRESTHSMEKYANRFALLRMMAGRL